MRREKFKNSMDSDALDEPLPNDVWHDLGVYLQALSTRQIQAGQLPPKLEVVWDSARLNYYWNHRGLSWKHHPEPLTAKVTKSPKGDRIISPGDRYTSILQLPIISVLSDCHLPHAK